MVPLTDAYHEHTHPEHMHQFLMCMLSMRITFPIFFNVHFVYHQHMHKELMRALSICIRN
jgi:hypothetical protein